MRALGFWAGGLEIPGSGRLAVGCRRPKAQSPQSPSLSETVCRTSEVMKKGVPKKKTNSPKAYPGCKVSSPLFWLMFLAAAGLKCSYKGQALELKPSTFSSEHVAPNPKVLPKGVEHHCKYGTMVFLRCDDPDSMIISTPIQTFLRFVGYTLSCKP